jgi:hypothetical protein
MIPKCPKCNQVLHLRQTEILTNYNENENITVLLFCLVCLKRYTGTYKLDQLT